MSQSLSPLGLPVTTTQVKCQYSCDEPATQISQRVRPCGHRVMPDILMCDGHAKEYGGTSAKNASRCGFRGSFVCMAVNQIRLTPPRPI